MRTRFCTIEDHVVETISQYDKEDYYCTSGTKIVPDIFKFIEEHKDEYEFFEIHFRLLGGKGGFGSLLRSFRVNRSTNQLMCRDLNGRRLASIDEERKLKKWIEKTAQRLKEKKEKEKAKYERLKAGDPKHDFNDPEYIRNREEILERTEDAFEEGFANFKKNKTTKRKIVVEEDSSDSDMDLDSFLQVGGRYKKKTKETPVVPEKKTKTEGEGDAESDNDDEDDENAAEVLEGLVDYFKNKPGGSDEGLEEISDVLAHSKEEGELPEVETAPEEPEPPKKTYIKRDIATDFEPIDLDKYEKAEDLHELGLDWIRHALNERGLKLGGSLEERAKRLFSVKGLNKKDYPANILAPKKK